MPAPEAGELDDFAKAVKAALEKYTADYKAYFERQNARVKGIKKILDTVPRVVLVPGLGVFSLGASAKDAEIAADIYVNAVATISDE